MAAEGTAVPVPAPGVTGTAKPVAAPAASAVKVPATAHVARVPVAAVTKETHVKPVEPQAHLSKVKPQPVTHAHVNAGLPSQTIGSFVYQPDNSMFPAVAPIIGDPNADAHLPQPAEDE